MFMSYNLRDRDLIGLPRRYADSEVYLNSNSTSQTMEPTTIAMTDEQLQFLITNILKVNREAPLATTSEVTQTSNGNFSKCSSRFYGKKDDCDAFIDAISVYKECLKINDDNALKGLSMLLDGQAATWWHGIKATVSTWEEAIKSLRHAFGYNKPPHQIYRELFSKEQGEHEPTDVFVANARALLSRLPKDPELQEAHKLNMIYGLLNFRIRERLPREQVEDFAMLINKARSIEENFLLKPESSVTTIRNATPTDKTAKIRPKCEYCHHFGHTKTDCRKLANRAIPSKSSAETHTPSSTASSSTNAHKLSCFGCGNPGYIRSNCPRCNNSGQASSSSSMMTFNMVNFSSLVPTGAEQERPMLPIRIRQFWGSACLDTGSKTSIAGAQLYKLLTSLGEPYEDRQLTIKLADGNERNVNAKQFRVTIELQSRKISTPLLAIDDFTNGRTLLGADFIRNAGIILDLSQNSWCFSDDPGKRYGFLAEEASNSICVNVVHKSDLSLGPAEGDILNTSERGRINSLLNEFADIFSERLEATPYAEHAIKLTEETPIAVPPYRLSPTKKKILEEELERMLAADIIESCESPFAAPVVLVPKKDGSYRVCVDYRKINAVTVPDRYPLPRIDELLHAAKKTKYMTTIDLRSGYWQVPVKEEDRDKTAFTSPFGNFRFKRMPFGLRNSPSTFQRLIDRLRSGLKDTLVLAYLDDIMILSSTIEEHLADLRAVFMRLRLFKLKANRTKCIFVRPKIRYLGHLLTPHGIQPDPAKVAAITDMLPPKNVKQLLTFIQTASWFRKFIPGYANLTKPLSDLTRKNAPWKWEAREVEAFEEVKRLLTCAPILRQADHQAPFIVRTDASSYAIGAALLQGESPNEKPIEYASRLLTTAEQNYSTTEREALAVVWACEKFRGYLENAKIKILSDHQPLRWLMSLKSPTGRLARWSLLLQSYDLAIEYTPGRCNAIADTLSRPPREEDSVTDICTTIVDLPVADGSGIRELQLEDPDLAKIAKALEATDDPVNATNWSERGYVMVNGILFRYSPDSEDEEAQQVVPKSQIPKILYEYHDSSLAGHYGVEKTLQKISRRYYWPGMRRSITQHVKECIECQRFKPSNHKPSGLLQTPIQNQRFEVLAMDLFGPLPETTDGFRWIFVIEDTSTRWVELFPLQTATAEICARTLVDEIILRYGTPRRVISDNGSQFVGEVMQAVAYCLGFKQVLTPSYHPEANPVERKNRDIKTQLAILTTESHTAWKDHLPSIRFAMNSTVSAATGHTPAFLTFGRELRTPDDVQRDLRGIIEKAPFVPQITPYLKVFSKVLARIRDGVYQEQDRSKLSADKRRIPGPNYEIGDKVLVETHTLSNAKAAYTTKFAPKRDGPYVIVKRVSPSTFQIASMPTPDIPLGTYHTSALTPFVENTIHSETTPIRPLRKRGRPKKLEDFHVYE